MVILAGQVTTGPRLSVTEMLWLQVLKFPQSSVDFHDLVMVYFCGHVPATDTSVKVIVGVTSQLSLEVGDPVLAGSVLASHSTVMLAGQVIVGCLLYTSPS